MLNRRALLALGLVPLAARATPRPVVGVEQFGGAARAGRDNSAPLRRALARAVAIGGDVVLGSGSYAISADALRSEGSIKRPSGVGLFGAGADKTALIVTGATATNPLFDASGASYVETRGLRLVGNAVRNDAAPYAGGVLVAALAANAAADMAGIHLVDCVVENFSSATWFHIVNLSPSRIIRDVGTAGCRWLSMPGTAPGVAQLTVPGHFVYVNGSDGRIEQVRVQSPLMAAAGVKGGVALVGDVAGAEVSIGRLVAPGGSLWQADGAKAAGIGAYGVLLYQRPGAKPRDVTIAVDELAEVASVGVYAVGAERLTIWIGRANGQRDTRDETLPKGVVALNACHDVSVRIDDARDCARVIMVALDGGVDGPQGNTSNIDILLPHIESRAGACDVVIAANGPNAAGGLRLRGQRTGPAQAGITLRAGPQAGLRDIDLSGFVGSGAARVIDVDGALLSRSSDIILPP
ncbi:hypothetical protein [Sphingomonas sp.]|uniref:hypothetical protein n=1 Tax=Sphingomonas sp. TaxID=28214 RepID=UPI001D690EC5|nr:hypothetical protein [Sphingomonas sp.]MBX9796725.1 hypothetical protein [Sphingomonas sp.]